MEGNVQGWWRGPPGGVGVGGRQFPIEKGKVSPLEEVLGLEQTPLGAPLPSWGCSQTSGHPHPEMKNPVRISLVLLLSVSSILLLFFRKIQNKG